MFPRIAQPGTYRVYHFHVGFAIPANSTLTLIRLVACGGLRVSTLRPCVPQLGCPGTSLDNLADRLMFRLAYRNFGDHESLVGNFTVKLEQRRRHPLVRTARCHRGPGHDLPGEHLSAGHHLALDGQCRDG